MRRCGTRGVTEKKENEACIDFANTNNVSRIMPRNTYECRLQVTIHDAKVYNRLSDLNNRTCIERGMNALKGDRSTGQLKPFCILDSLLIHDQSIFHLLQAIFSPRHPLRNAPQRSIQKPVARSVWETGQEDRIVRWQLEEWYLQRQAPTHEGNGNG